MAASAATVSYAVNPVAEGVVLVGRLAVTGTNGGISVATGNSDTFCTQPTVGATVPRATSEADRPLVKAAYGPAQWKLGRGSRRRRCVNGTNSSPMRSVERRCRRLVVVARHSSLRTGPGCRPLSLLALSLLSVRWEQTVHLWGLGSVVRSGPIP